MNTVWLALLTGLTSGGISCFAVQGGLLASSLANQKKDNQKKATLMFLVSRLLAYTTLGALLGTFGAKIVISPKTQGLMQILAGIFMILTAARMAEIHPILKKITLTPPKSVFRLLRKESRNEGIYASFTLGFLTVLIPCGVTQAMMLLAISSGSPLYGGLILGSYVLGTTPLFLGLGLASGQMLKYLPLRYATVLLIFALGVISINTGQILRGSPHTLQNYWLAATGTQKKSTETAKVNTENKQEVEITVTSTGYQSNVKTLKAGVPVKLVIKSENAVGCIRAFTIPEYNISKVLPQDGTTILEFTPMKKGRLAYTCSMGMFSNFFEVE